jgi:nitrate reductase NapE component
LALDLVSAFALDSDLAGVLTGAFAFVAILLQIIYGVCTGF